MSDLLLQLIYSSALQAQKMRKNEKIVERLPWQRAVKQLRDHLVATGAWQ